MPITNLCIQPYDGSSCLHVFLTRYFLHFAKAANIAQAESNSSGCTCQKQYHFEVIPDFKILPVRLQNLFQILKTVYRLKQNCRKSPNAPLQIASAPVSFPRSQRLMAPLKPWSGSRIPSMSGLPARRSDGPASLRRRQAITPEWDALGNANPLCASENVGH